MKVLVIPSWYPPNGGMFFVHQSQWLMEKGFEVTVVVAEEKSLKKCTVDKILYDLSIHRHQEFEMDTWRKVQLRIPRLNRINDWLWIRTAYDLAEKYICENGKPDLIQAHSCLWGGYVSSLLKDKYGIPYLITEHRGRFNEKSFYSQKEIAPRYIPHLKKALSMADAIIPVSERLIVPLENIAGRRLPCITVPNPVDENFF